MLYELIAVVRPGKVAEAKEIARTIGTLILSRAGVIRSLNNWGTYLLSKPVSKNQAGFIEGQHFVMRFDSSPQVQQEVRKALSLDPRMIKFGVVKVANERLSTMAEVGAVRWTRKPEGERFFR